MGMTTQQLGQIGEHMVCADLLAQGYNVSIASAGSPFDVSVDADGRLLRIQVKTTTDPILKALKTGDNWAYMFRLARSTTTSRNGKQVYARYTKSEVDLFALVALDTKQIGYLPSPQESNSIFVFAEREDDPCASHVRYAKRDDIMRLCREGHTHAEIATVTGMNKSYVSSVLNSKEGATKPRYLREMPFEYALTKLRGSLLS